MATNSPGFTEYIQSPSSLISVLPDSGFWLISLSFFLEVPTSEWNARGSHSVPVLSCTQGSAPLLLFFGIPFPRPRPQAPQGLSLSSLQSRITGHLRHEALPNRPKREASFLPGLGQTTTLLLVLEQPSGPAGMWCRTVIGRVSAWGCGPHPPQQEQLPLCVSALLPIYCVRFRLKKGSSDKKNLDLSESDGE